MSHPRVLIAFAQAVGDAELDEFADHWPTALAARLRGMRAASARAHSMTGYRLLELGLGLVNAEGARLAALKADSNGRPVLPDGPDFNISHSRGLVGCAIGVGCRVGFDIERIRQINTQRLMRFLSPEEATTSARNPEVFFSAWAAREASVKAGGKVGLARISRVEIDDGVSRIDGEAWHLTYPVLASEYAACLACGQADVEIQIQDFSASLRDC